MGSTYFESHQFEEAVVVDVITNDEHPLYDELGYAVGAVKFRFLGSDVYTADDKLDWAFPMLSNITDYPLINEIILVLPILNRHYYTNRINTRNKITTQALYGVERIHGEQDSEQDTVRKYDASATGGAPIVDDPQSSDTKLGRTFEEKENTYRLRAQEGDIIFEGRSGHSIRLGANVANDHAPTLILRAGQDPVVEPENGSIYGLIQEDLNKDLSSIWMVTDQIISLDFATIDSDTHFISMEDKPSTLDGNQIAINSDRVLLNSKRDRIFITSFLGTHLGTLQDFTVDVEKNYKSYVKINRELTIKQDYVITITRDYLLDVEQNQISIVGGQTNHDTVGTHSIRSDKFYLGSVSDESEPLVLGEALRLLLLEFVDAHLNNATAHTLPTIGIGPLSPSTITALRKVRNQLETIKDAPFESKNAFHPPQDGWETPIKNEDE